jgi:hypothetical protein
LNMKWEKKDSSTILGGLNAGRSITEIDKFSNLTIKKWLSVTNNDYLATGRLTEEFSSGSNVG